MHGVGLIGAIIIGIIAGWLAEKIMKRDHGLLTNLLVGIGGALIGGFLANIIGLRPYGWIGSLLTSTVGAVLLLAVLGALKKRGR